jgi:hypothetical protein
MAVSGVARLQGEQPAAVFYPFGHPTPYNYASFVQRTFISGLKYSFLGNIKLLTVNLQSATVLWAAIHPHK